MIKISLLKQGIIAEISYRLKDPYSALKKMILKNTSIKDLTDLIAFRIIVATEEDCYKALKVVYNIFDVVPKSFKDFITKPKSNGYQSLHTIIIAQTGCNIELQIRSRRMHVNAEFGEASHIKYKNEPETKIKTLFSSTFINMNLIRAYDMLDYFHWTKAELIAYKNELQNIFQLYQSSTNSLIYQNNQL
jgi:(p)ppGpp synthase/HD superfamily hydrolase